MPNAPRLLSSSDLERLHQELLLAVQQCDPQGVRRVCAQAPRQTQIWLNEPGDWMQSQPHRRLASLLESSLDTLVQLQPSKPWVELIDTVMDQGLQVRSPRLFWWHSATRPDAQPQTVLWALDRGAFDEDALKDYTGHQWGRNGSRVAILTALSQKGALAMRLLDQCVERGLVGVDSGALIRMQDLIGKNLFDCAQHLLDRGFVLPVYCANADGSENISSPAGLIETHVQAAVARYNRQTMEWQEAHSTQVAQEGVEQENVGQEPLAQQNINIEISRQQTQWAQEELQGLHWLSARGVPLSLWNGGERGTCHALALLLSSLGEHSVGTLADAHPHALIETLGAELLRLGANPNDGDLLARLFVPAREQREGLAGAPPLASKANGESQTRAGVKTPKAQKTLLSPVSDSASDSASVAACTHLGLNWFIEHGLDLSQHTSVLLLQAVQSHDTAFIVPRLQTLEAWGVHADSLTPTDSSALKYALMHSNWKAAAYLIGAGAPWHFIDGHGESVLHVLAERNSEKAHGALAQALKVPRVLALINAASTANHTLGQTALHRACAALSLAQVEQLLKAGAHVNAQDSKGWTPLRHALRQGSLKAQTHALPVVKCLLAHGVDPSVPDQRGRSPAVAAIARAPLPALMELLERRPQELGSDSKIAKKAREKIRQRGPLGFALAEQGEFRQALGIVAGSAGPSATQEDRLHQGSQPPLTDDGTTTTIPARPKSRRRL